MKEKLTVFLIGLVFEVTFAFWLFFIYASANPQATNMDKGIVFFIGGFVIAVLIAAGFKIGQYP